MQVMLRDRGLRTDSDTRPEDRLPVPRQPADLMAHYDLTISHPEIDQIEFSYFDRYLARAARERGLSCALVHRGTVQEFITRLTTGQMRIGYHLDYYALWNRPDDPFARLTEAVQDTGGWSINAPARARAFTDKSAAHAELVRRGLGAPATLIYRPWTPDRVLTSAEREMLGLDEAGTRLYLKPANGFGGRGITQLDRFDGEGLRDIVAGARTQDRQETYLLQREVRTPMLRCEDGVDRPAYWRVLSCLGEWMPFWWSPLNRLTPGQTSYVPVSTAELHQYRLQPVLGYAQMLGELSGLEWFSTELCLSEGSETSIFTVIGPDGQERPVVAIDYINDQCAVDVQGRWIGAVPDSVVRHLAERFADAAWQKRQKAIRPAKGWSYRVAA
jgi:hypothetical protein